MFEIASFALKPLQARAVRAAPARAIRTAPAHMPSMRRVSRRAVWPARPAIGAPAVWLSPLAVMTSPRMTPPAG